MITPNYDLDIDSTLGGDNASDYVIPSQKAIKSYVDNNTGSTVDQVYDPTSQLAQSGIAIAGANFLTSSDLTNYVTTDTDQDITGVKTYVGQKRIGFKQSGSSDKLGFTLYNNNNVEKGYLEFNPTNLVDGAPLMTLGNYATAAAGITHVGFRKYSSVSGASGAYNLLAPLISNAKTPFNLTTTYTNFYLPLGFTDGTTMVKTASTGVVDLSSLLPDVSNFVTNSSLATTLEDYVTNSSLATTLTDYVTNSALNTTLEDYQLLLISGTNIKTINSTSLLGSGNIAVGTVTSVNNVSPVNGNVTLSIPTVNNATLTLQKNGTTVKTFTANASTDVTANITVPTKTSELTNDAGFIDGITSSDVTTALGYTPYSSANPSGYQANVIETVKVNGTAQTVTSKAVDITVPTKVSQLTNDSGYTSNVGTVTSVNNVSPVSGNVTLSIPTVNNATLTIQKNGSTVKTFTANASTDVTCNITVPTKTSDLTNDSSFITGITSSDVTTALGYTPYNSTNPSGYQANVIETIKVNGTALTPTSKTVNITVPSAVTESTVSGWGFTKNVGTVTKVNNTSPDSNGNVSLSIPTVNNATLTIQKNGTAVKTFTANASTDVTCNITVPTKTSDLTNDSSFITGITSSMVTTALGYTPYSSANPSGYQANVIETIKVNNVAQTVTSKTVNITVPSAVTESTVSGWGFTKNVGTVTSVNSTSPDANGNVTLSIPTVNNATLTIQKNGTTVKTFTANASSNVTANITVPTKTSELTNDSSFITGITSSMVTTALGYTPYSSANPSGYQANVIETIKVNNVAQTVTSKTVNITVPSAVTESTVSGWGFTKNTGTVTSVNNVSPVNGNVSLTIPTYNFYGDPFYSTDGDTAGITRDCNGITANGHYYYTSNGPSGLGEQSTDGAIYVQGYNDNWVTQIAQDYRTGNLFVRSRNNGTWVSWKAIANKSDIPDTSTLANTDLSNLSSTGESHFGKITEIKMNNTSMGTSGVVDLGTVITSHQDISGKANTSLNNLSATGKTVLDGQWTALNQAVVASGTSVNGSSALPKTVNVPNDGHVYEVLFTAACTTGTSSGNAVYVEIATNKVSGINICGCRTRANNDVGSRGSVIVPISYASNNFSLTRSTGLNGTCAVTAKCYRRVGTNS